MGASPAKSSGNSRGKKSEPQRNGSKPRGKSTSHTKQVEIFEIVLFFLALFTALALAVYDPDISTVNWIGTLGHSFTHWTILFFFGRFGTIAVPIAVFLFLVGRWSKGGFHSWRWVGAAVSAGFLTGLVTAVVMQLLGKAPDADLTGMLPLLINQQVNELLGVPGILIVTVVVAFVLSVFLFDSRPTSLLNVLFVRFPLACWRGFIGLFYRKVPALDSDTTDEPESESEPELDEKPEPIDDDLPPWEEPSPPPAPLPAPKEPPVELPKATESSQQSAYVPPWRKDSEAKPIPRKVIPPPPPAPYEPERRKPLPVTVKSSTPIPQPRRDGAVALATPPYQLPPLKLLNDPPADRPMVDAAEMEEKSRLLEEKLASLKIQAEVVKVNPGPVITRFDLKPAPNVKIARIANTADDIAMILKAKGVRILAPIPGEAAVGIEIANLQPQTVYIREALESDQFSRAKAPLTVALGKDTNGAVFCIDLARMPHLLIAGATGSGKSVCINVILGSLLFRTDPNDVRVVLVDPKKIELSLYGRLSKQHLVSAPGLGEDVITTPTNAVKVLRSVHMEMERRYDILAQVGVRGLDEYNQWVKKTAGEAKDEDNPPERLPYIVVIIDELADLMMTVRRDFEELVVRLAQMARAVGIHLVIATQRPSVDVVTGLIKANFPSRIAFQVATRVDSRTIIDSIGAEALLGRGDMLYMGPGTAAIQRLHGALITTEEVEAIIEFVRSQPPVASKFVLPDPELQRIEVPLDGGVDSAGMETGSDDLFLQAAKIVVETEQGSASMLQRRLRVGYARAARLIDELERAGIVGAFDGSKARQVLMTPEELKERYGV